MTKTLYLMRHGETLFNQLHKKQGWCDSPLTAKGIAQAKIAGEYFHQRGIVFDACYASTSERACDTLELVTDQPYQRLKGLKEWYFGLFEGQDEALNPQLPYGDFFVYYGGEAEMAMRQRINQTLLKMMEEVEGETILAVSHGAAIRGFMRVWEEYTQVPPSNRLPNCCIMRFTYENKQFILEEMITHDFSEI